MSTTFTMESKFSFIFKSLVNSWIWKNWKSKTRGEWVQTWLRQGRVNIKGNMRKQICTSKKIVARRSKMVSLKPNIFHSSAFEIRHYNALSSNHSYSLNWVRARTQPTTKISGFLNQLFKSCYLLKVWQ